jgi:enamine deaminase RidA (YjgF/YER057c/UK114 family)
VPNRVNYSSGSPWEPLRGYSRAVRFGDHLYISGTTAQTKSGEIAGGAYEQTRLVLERVKRVLVAAGFKLSDVTRTRLFVTNMTKWDEYARAHREVFDTIRPVSSIVEVSRLVDPRLMVEMEVEAILGASSVDFELVDLD